MIEIDLDRLSQMTLGRLNEIGWEYKETSFNIKDGVVYSSIYFDAIEVKSDEWISLSMLLIDDTIIQVDSHDFSWGDDLHYAYVVDEFDEDKWDAELEFQTKHNAKNLPDLEWTIIKTVQSTFKIAVEQHMIETDWDRYCT